MRLATAAAISMLIVSVTTIACEEQPTNTLASKVKINVSAENKTFKLTCYEDDGFGGDEWVITQDANPEIPDDEISSFKLEGDAGIHVEFFNDDEFKKDKKTWAEAKLIGDGEKMEIKDMRVSTGNYTYHKASGDDNIDGKVSAIRVTVAK